MKHHILTAAFLVVLFSVSPAFAGWEEKLPQWDGNRTVPVHVLPIMDQFNQTITPASSNPFPFSTRFSCEPCHDYSKIRTGRHFDADSSSDHGRPGEPWFWVDEKTGTILPLSYRGWKGTWLPESIGLSGWDFTALFARHMPGGGAGEPPEGGTVAPTSRWEVSGPLEINCLACHNASGLQSHSEWAKQVLRQNYRWAAVASSGLGEVGGMASRLPETWTVVDGPNPDDSEYAVVPFVRYDNDRFDTRNRVFFDIASKPMDQRCLVCHSVSPRDRARYAVDEDVHSASGLECVDCHRNDLNHDIIRGYDLEAAETGNPHAFAFSCRGCHLGRDMTRKGGPDIGKLGAPEPRHAGIPKVHFERLACTVCHSGVIPAKRASRVRTSRANRLGIYGAARWDTEMPYILEPVFGRDHEGRIVPNRAVWPAYWARMENGRIFPLQPGEILEAAGDILMVEERLAEILISLSGIEDLAEMVVLVAEGKAFSPNVDRRLDVASAPEEIPSGTLYWAVAGENALLPLIPPFDPGAEALDADVEMRISAVLEALQPFLPSGWSPVLVSGTGMYEMTEGYLEKKENIGKSAPSPLLEMRSGEVLSPLISQLFLRILRAEVGEESSLTEEQVSLILNALEAKNASGDAVASPSAEWIYISGGRMYRLSPEGHLTSAVHEAAKPVMWPIAHQVRPARQALGINGCGDCHSAGSNFFFARIEAPGPLAASSPESQSAHIFMGLDRPYQMLFGLSFTIRPLFKWLLLGAAVLIGSVCILAFFLFLGRVTGLLNGRS